MVERVVSLDRTLLFHILIEYNGQDVLYRDIKFSNLLFHFDYVYTCLQ
jgi:hypothetical protein